MQHAEHTDKVFSIIGGSGGADLNYTDDDLDSYSTIWDGEVTSSGKKDHKRQVVYNKKNGVEKPWLIRYNFHI